MSILYERLSALCQEHGISAYRMCKDTGIQPSIMTDVKMGRRQSLKAETAAKIAAYFGVSVDYLIGNTKEKEKPASQEADELIKSDPLAGQLFAAYGRVKEEFSQAEIDDITMIMEMLAEKKRRKREKGEG